MNVLILRVSAIGDVIHTLPAIFLIKKVYPKAKISWVVQEKAADLLINQPFIENVWILPDKFLTKKNRPLAIKTIKNIRRIKWDAIIDFQGIIKTTLVLLTLRGKKYGFDFNNARLWATTFFTKHHTKPIYTNIIQKNLALASNMLQDKLNIKTNPTLHSLQNSFKLHVPETNKAKIETWLLQNKIKNFIILAPNTTWPSKLWPQENWEQLTELLLNNKYFSAKYSIILIGKDFGNQAQKLASFINKKQLNIKLAPSWDLLTTSYLIKKSDLLVAPDTGVLHIADFLGKKSIGIFGPTFAKKHGPFLLDENIENVIQVNCPHHYQKTHGNMKKNKQKDRTQWDCMYKLSPEMLLTTILQILGGKQL